MTSAMDQDPKWKFDATPPPWAIGVVMLLSIEVHLLSAIVLRVVTALTGIEFR